MIKPEAYIDSPAHRFVFMGAKLDALTMEQTLGIAEESIKSRRRLQHVVVNVAKLVHMQEDNALRADVNGSDLVNIDGMGVVWGARLCGHSVPERVSGIDIMDRLLALCADRGYKPFFLGARQEILERAIANIRLEHPQLRIAGWNDGYFTALEEPQIIERIAASGADCLFIAISSPVKERLLAQYRESLNVPFLMGVGGSIDIKAGLARRAPVWMQRAGLEWAFRLLQEPRRMFGRYWTTNTRYAKLLMREFLSSRKKAPARVDHRFAHQGTPRN